MIGDVRESYVSNFSFFHLKQNRNGEKMSIDIDRTGV